MEDKRAERLLMPDIAAFAVGLLVLFAIQIAATGAWDAISRPLWFDECVTSLLANDPGAAHEFHALMTAEPNTPGLFILLRPLHLFRALSPVELRLFSFVCIYLAIVGAYACLRQFTGRSVAIAAALLLWAQPLVMRHAFEARYYAPMLACAVAFALALQWRGRLAPVLLAATSLALCMIHYFGILILIPMLAAHWIWNRRPARKLLPALVGPAALIAWTPIFLQQRASFPVATWIRPLSAQLIEDFLRELLPFSLIAIVAIALAMALVLKTRPRDESSRAPAALLSLLIVPLILLLFTILIQPVLVARYAIAFCLGLAASVAMVLRMTRPIAAWAVAVLCITASSLNLRQLSQTARDETAGLRQLAASTTHAGSRRPVLFSDGRLLFPIYYGFTNSGLDIRFFDAPASDAFNGFLRQVIHNVGAQYPGPTLCDPSQAAQLDSFLLVCSPGASPPAKLATTHTFHRLNSCVFLATGLRTAQAGN